MNLRATSLFPPPPPLPPSHRNIGAWPRNSPFSVAFPPHSPISSKVLPHYVLCIEKRKEWGERGGAGGGFVLCYKEKGEIYNNNIQEEGCFEPRFGARFTGFGLSRGGLFSVRGKGREEAKDN